MNQPVLNQHVPNTAPPAAQGLNPASLQPENMQPENLQLRDIHLPDPISWWPIAPGWWIILASLVLIVVVIYTARKYYQSRQLKRDIRTELEQIKQQFHTSQSKAQLAKALSILLRRTSISYYPGADIAGLTGRDWLNYLDNTHTNNSAASKFNSKVGEILLSAPYLPDDTEQDFDAQALIRLCESWLRATHKKTALTSPARLSQTTHPQVRMT